MEVRKIIFAAAALLLASVTLFLYMKVAAPSNSGAEASALERAKREYEQHQDQARSRQAREVHPAHSMAGNSSTGFEAVHNNPNPASQATPSPSLMTRPRPADGIPSAHDAIVVGDRTWGDKLRSVNRLYDRKQYEEAREAALVLLDKQPDNRRMLRVVVSASCIMAEPAIAREYYAKLPVRDQKTMAKRCARYGVDDLE